MTNNLTGVWDGTYVQAQRGVTFLATLIDADGALGGNVTEPCMWAGCPSGSHNASISGHRSGSVVSFIKRYEPSACSYDTVSYEGAVNTEETEIDGRWRIPGAPPFSGTFLMVRSTRPAQAVMTEEQVKEPAR